MPVGCLSACLPACVAAWLLALSLPAYLLACMCCLQPVSFAECFSVGPLLPAYLTVCLPM